MKGITNKQILMLILFGIGMIILGYMAKGIKHILLHKLDYQTVGYLLDMDWLNQLTYPAFFIGIIFGCIMAFGIVLIMNQRFKR